MPSLNRDQDSLIKKLPKESRPTSLIQERKKWRACKWAHKLLKELFHTGRQQSLRVRLRWWRRVCSTGSHLYNIQIGSGFESEIVHWQWGLAREEVIAGLEMSLRWVGVTFPAAWADLSCKLRVVDDTLLRVMPRGTDGGGSWFADGIETGLSITQNDEQLRAKNDEKFTVVEVESGGCWTLSWIVKW